MSILYLVLLIIFSILLILVLAAKPNLSSLSLFELERRAKIGSKEAKEELLRVRSFDTIASIIRIKTMGIQVGLTCFAILYFDWWLGVFVVLVIAVVCNLLAGLKPIKKIAQKVYNLTEKPVLNFVKNHQNLTKILGGDMSISKAHNLQIKSREELLQLIAESEGALSIDEKRLITNSLSFKERDITSVMTPRNKIETVDRSEFLGPLVLNELHKTGHSHLPVISGDVDHIIGILNISSLLSLDTKKSTTAEKAMDQNVYYIHENRNLFQALSIFLRTQHRLLIVVNQAKETVGVIVLKDVIEALVGHRDDNIEI